jgi:hypothetical protein
MYAYREDALSQLGHSGVLIHHPLNTVSLIINTTGTLLTILKVAEDELLFTNLLARIPRPLNSTFVSII